MWGLNGVSIRFIVSTQQILDPPFSRIMPIVLASIQLELFFTTGAFILSNFILKMKRLYNWKNKKIQKIKCHLSKKMNRCYTYSPTTL